MTSSHWLVVNQSNVTMTCQYQFYSKQFYKQILSEKGPRLHTAKERMGNLKESLRKAKTPLALQEEVDLAIKLIQLCLDGHS